MDTPVPSAFWQGLLLSIVLSIPIWALIISIFRVI